MLLISGYLIIVAIITLQISESKYFYNTFLSIVYFIRFLIHHFITIANILCQVSNYFYLEMQNNSLTILVVLVFYYH